MRWLCALAVPALGLCGCQPAVDRSGWTERDLGAFSFRAPTNLVGGPRQGIDSFVGEYQSRSFALWYDYGAYSGMRFTKDDAQNSRFVTPAKIETLRVDGRQAWIMTGRQRSADCEYTVALSIEAVEDHEHLGVMNLGMTSCGAEESVPVVKAIYRSIRLKTSAH